jgi:hypothetical protein
MGAALPKGEECKDLGCFLIIRQVRGCCPSKSRKRENRRIYIGQRYWGFMSIMPARESEAVS